MQDDLAKDGFPTLALDLRGPSLNCTYFQTQTRVFLFSPPNRPVLVPTCISNSRTLTLFLPGHGESPIGVAGDFSTEMLAADVRAAVRSHGVTAPFVLASLPFAGSPPPTSLWDCFAFKI